MLPRGPSELNPLPSVDPLLVLEMQAIEFDSIMFNLFIAVSPEIFIINATFILLIHGVVFSTSKKYDYPPLVSNVGWLGLLTVSRLGGQLGRITPSSVSTV